MRKFSEMTGAELQQRFDDYIEWLKRVDIFKDIQIPVIEAQETEREVA